MANDQIQVWLESAGLGKHGDQFRALKIDEAKFLKFTMADYSLVGITALSERKALFQLLQQLKLNKENVGRKGAGSNGNEEEEVVEKKSATTASKPSKSSKASKSAHDKKSKQQKQNQSQSVGVSSGKEKSVKQEDSNVLADLFSSKKNQKKGSSAATALMDASDQAWVAGKGKGAAGSSKAGSPVSSTDMDPPEEWREMLAEKIRVCVRKRPISCKELANQEADIVAVVDRKTMIVNEPKVKLDLTPYVEEHRYQFDECFAEDASNPEVYARTARPLVESIFHKAKATCFAYGQTGSGKTYTMLGNNGDGLYLAAAADIFQRVRDFPHLSVWISFFEIYGGKLFDLLNDRNKLFARDNGQGEVCIRGLKEFEVSSVDGLMGVISKGATSRSVGTTAANSDSSRSHAVLQIVLKTNNKKQQETWGKFSFIDLAGSERGSETGPRNKKTRLEGAEINKSLLALKECIRALDQDSKHTPFRQSTLTQVLKDSFTGNSRTVMIAAISPNSPSAEHTLNTLRYADRVKELQGPGATSTNLQQQLAQNQTGAVWPPKAASSPMHKSVKTASAPAAASSSSTSANVSMTMKKKSTGSSVASTSASSSSSSASSSGPLNKGSSSAAATAKRSAAAAAASATTKSKQATAAKTQKPKKAPAAAEPAPTAPPASESMDYSPQLVQDITDIVALHRTAIHESMEVIKQEMELLDVTIDDAEEPRIEEYIEALDAILNVKKEQLDAIKEKVDKFKSFHMETV